MFCPICHKPENPDFEPFCSKTCKNIDLLRWFKEDYRIPTQEPITDEAIADHETEEDEQ